MPTSAAKVRWKFSFGRSSSSSSSTSSSSSPASTQQPIPMSFICPISSTLMSDPVIVPTGFTFERACIEACTELGFTPPCLLSSSIDLSSSSSSSSSFLLIPNAALRAAIIDWCDRVGAPHPSPISLESARSLVQGLMMKMPNSNSNSRTPPPPPPKFQSQQLVQQQEEEDSTRSKSACFTPSPPSSSCSYPSSSSSSSSSSSEIISDDSTKTTHKPTTPSPSPSSSSSSSDPLEEEILLKLKSPLISVKESGLITLRQSTRESSDLRISLCTPKLLAAVVPMVQISNSKHRSNPSTIQTHATAAIVNLSIEPANKVKIVRAGAIPPLVHALNFKSSEEVRGNAAGALFSLALEDENKLAIGVLGAIPPLVSLFSCHQSSSGHGHLARVEAGMALYHLSLAPNNLSKIAKTAGAVKALLNVAIAKGGGDEEEESTSRQQQQQLRRVAMMVLASLARMNEGRVALMDADAVKAIVEMMKEGASSAGKEEEEEYCLGLLYEMSKGISLRFRALARAAGAAEVLASAKDKEGRGEVGKEMARRTLKVIRGKESKGEMMMMMMMMNLGDEGEEEEEDEEEEEEEEMASVVSDGLVSFRRRYNDFGGSSASNSANF